MNLQLLFYIALKEEWFRNDALLYFLNHNDSHLCEISYCKYFIYSIGINIMTSYSDDNPYSNALSIEGIPFPSLVMWFHHFPIKGNNIRDIVLEVIWSALERRLEHSQAENKMVMLL